MFTFRNWKILMVSTIVAILLFWFPPTRAAILWVLPLGSGVDDFVFLCLLTLAFILLLIRVMPVKDKLKKIANWIMK